MKKEMAIKKGVNEKKGGAEEGMREGGKEGEAGGEVMVTEIILLFFST